MVHLIGRTAMVHLIGRTAMVPGAESAWITIADRRYRSQTLTASNHFIH